MKTIQLLAEVLHAGCGCPVCGGEKTSRGRTCRLCYQSIGSEATKAVDAVTEAILKVREGHNAALKSSGQVVRQITFGPILAQVEIAADAELNRPANGFQPYWESKIDVAGGFVSLFVFGAETARPGETVTAQVELKTKLVRGRTFSYVRAQVVLGVSSNVELVINNIGGAGYKLADSLPSTEVKETPRYFQVGFTAVKSAALDTSRLDAKQLLALLSIGSE